MDSLFFQWLLTILIFVVKEDPLLITSVSYTKWDLLACLLFNDEQISYPLTKFRLFTEFKKLVYHWRLTRLLICFLFHPAESICFIVCKISELTELVVQIEKNFRAKYFPIETEQIIVDLFRHLNVNFHRQNKYFKNVLFKFKHHTMYCVGMVKILV